MCSSIGEKVRKRIFLLKDDKYREFHSRLVPGEENIVGVRVPVLRQYAKELSGEYKNNIDELISSIGDVYYEEIMLQGMIIGLQKKIQVQWLMDKIDEFVPKINNWGVCDVFCSGLKEVKKHRKEFYKFLKKYLASDEEFKIRFGIVMLLGYFIDEEYIDDVLKVADGIKNEEYYVEMAVAWLISICFVKFYDKTKAYMQNCNLNDFTYNKALQKARESYRITKKQKDELNAMKRKVKRV